MDILRLAKAADLSVEWKPERLRPPPVLEEIHSPEEIDAANERLARIEATRGDRALRRRIELAELFVDEWLKKAGRTSEARA